MKTSSCANTGSGYHVFAGKECSRALALMSLKPEDCNSNLDDLDESKLKVLGDWKKVGGSHLID